MNDRPASPAARSWPDYRAVWRWHFYAGLFCIPFVIVLSISGSIYLFKPQIEAWIDRPFDHLTVTGPPAAVADQVQAATDAVPGSTPTGYELPLSPRSAARILVRSQGESLRVYVHPQTLTVLQIVAEDKRFMRVLFRLHGELWMGDRGSNLVELAASWTIVMIVTGLYLWFPRQTKGWGGVVYPRLGSGSRIFWRDLHSVTGLWISCLALFLLLSGLPWAKFWGNYLRTIRKLTGTSVAQQDWSTGSERTRRGDGDRGSGGEHGDHRGGNSRDDTPPKPIDLKSFDRVAAAVAPLGLPHPVVIAPPAGGSSGWTAKSLTPNRPRRITLVIDPATGKILSREGFNGRHPIDQLVSIGIAAHEGQLFGWPNQLLGLITALGLVLISLSGVILWWRRREPGTLGAPQVTLDPRFSVGLILLVVLFGVYLPLFGASLLAVLAVEKLVLCRIPRVREWLGLRAPAFSAAARGAAVLLVAILVAGCGPRPVVGGTKGTLFAAGDALSEVQVTVHQIDGGSWQPIGFGVTGTNGEFELVTNGAAGPLRLAPGSFRCTLESVGAPIVIPREYLAAATTPLEFVRASSDEEVRLAIPRKLLR